MNDFLDVGVEFYTPTTLLNKKDKYKNTPEIFLSCSNRGAGKTYGFGKEILDLYFHKTELPYLKNMRKFALLCRKKGDLGSVASGIFSVILHDHFNKYTIEETVMQKGVYSVIQLCSKIVNDEDEEESYKETCGYVLPINSSDDIKKISSNFYDVDAMFFDEFQCDNYVPNEINKFVNIHTSVARGGPNGVRFVPVFMASNSLDINNPYFEELGITTKIQDNTRFYRGDGFVLERFVNLSVAERQRESAFNRAFANNKQMQSNIDNTWLNSDFSCVCKPESEWGKNYYLCTLSYNETNLAVRFYDNGYYYINRSVDLTHPNFYNVNPDGKENLTLFARIPLFEKLRENFFRGRVRFSDIAVKKIMTDNVI